MKAISALILSLILIVVPFASISYASEEPINDIDSVLISDDGTSLTVSCTVSDVTASQNSTFYLFRVTPNNEGIKNLSPISQAKANGGSVIFTLTYDSSDHSAPLYGYVLAVSNGKKGYTALSKAKYIDNVSSIAHSDIPFSVSNTKKGLEVQYITDAQMLGVGHAVVFAKLNELITVEGDNAHGYVYGESKYYIDKEALTLLDYRVKTLSEAGINVYINYVLTFDSNARSDLYYPNAEGTTNTIYAPNLSTLEGVKTYASLMHFIAERYSMKSGSYGFCGSYILGYEVNNEADTNSAGLKDLSDYAKAYATFVRVADLATHTAYSKARIYLSLSNIFNTSAETLKSGLFGGKEFLTELVKYVKDVDFNVAINPYPSTLSQSAFWNDEKATFDEDTEYITMKNISVLTEFLQKDEMLYNGSPRRVIVSEFGISGVYGEESEKIQAAAYAYAFFTAQKNPLIDAFIWHRHVDHISEINLNYGLYSSSELTLEGKDKKIIHSVFSSIDDANSSREVVSSLITYLPISSYDELVAGVALNRNLLTIKNTRGKFSDSLWNKGLLFDFSKSIYDFYPSDNSEYLETVNEGTHTFMRVAMLKLSPIENMGIGTSISTPERFEGKDYIAVRVRVHSQLESADISLIITGNSGTDLITINNTATINTNEWITLTFPISNESYSGLENCNLKLWARSDSSRDEQIIMDVAWIKLYEEKNVTPVIILIVVIVIAILSAFFAAAYVYIMKARNAKNIKK